MRILITNDDGFNADGIKSLQKADQLHIKEIFKLLRKAATSFL